jgi:hypothetical protein
MGIRAKQRQFRAWHGHLARGSESWALALMPLLRWPGYPTIPVFHHSTIPIRCRLCQTKPNLGALGDLGDQTRATGQTRQTNPIRGGAARTTIVKARSLGDATPQGSYRAKQTQFGVFSSDEGYPCEQTNPISGPAGAPRTPDCAKGTQPPAGRQAPTIPIFHHSSIPAGWRSCQTNPIAAFRPIRRSAFPGGPIVRNKPNLPPTGRQGRRWGKSCETNPISTAPAGRPEHHRSRACETKPIRRSRTGGTSHTLPDRRPNPIHGQDAHATRPAPDVVEGRIRIAEFRAGPGNGLNVNIFEIRS